jgi:hypothetical protein
MDLIFTGVGSRDIPHHYLKDCYQIGVRFGQLGATCRSGHAPNSDCAFEQGTKRGGGRIESFLPGVFLNEQLADEVEFFDATQFPNWPEAQALAASVHPNWNAVVNSRSDFALRAHTRNAYQVLGSALDRPSDLLVCYAPPNADGSVKGGTNTAWQLAKQNSVPCYNIAVEEDRDRLKEFLLKLRTEKSL